MPRQPDERVVQAEAMYRQGMKLVDIAEKLELPAGTVRRWKTTYKWDPETQKKKKKQNERSDSKKQKKSERSEPKKKRRGGQPGNHNATGPPGNRNAEKYGFFSRYLPEETKEIVEGIQDADPIDLLWHQIQLAYAAILRAQNMFYTNRVTKDTRMAYTAFLTAQSKAQGELNRMLQRYEAMTAEADEERQMKLEERKLKLEEQKMKLEEQRIRLGMLKRDTEDPDEEDEENSFLKALEGMAEEDWADETDEEENDV